MIKLIKILDAHQVLMQFADVKMPYGATRKLSAITKITGDEMAAFEKKRDELAEVWREKDITDEERNKGYAAEINEILNSELDIELPKIKEDLIEKLEFSLRDLAIIDFLIEE